MKEKRKPNIFLRAALVLLCMVLLSTHFTAGLYARYTTSAKGSDQSRLASFSVKAEQLSVETYQNVAACSFHVANPGETAVRYSCIIKIDGNDCTSVCMFTQGSGSGVLFPNNQTVLQFNVDLTQISTLSPNPEHPIEISVTFTQID